MQQSAFYPQRPIRRRDSHNPAGACYLSWRRLPNSNEPQMSPAVPICKSRSLLEVAGRSALAQGIGKPAVFEHSVFEHREEQ